MVKNHRNLSRPTDLWLGDLTMLNPSPQDEFFDDESEQVLKDLRNADFAEKNLCNPAPV